MELMPDDIRAKLLANGAVLEETDHLPVVKYFDPCGAATWIITELMPAEGDGVEPDILFGLCDLGMGCPELGYVSLAELESVKGRLGLGIERDLHFRARYPLSVYAHAANRRGRIVESDALLAESAAILGIAPVADSTTHQPHPDAPSDEHG
ncbi:DUF2958 domain-containing protein [Dongia sedimenti]|uniref:DUF2958 domain-containing protein n=1 Tax=Dongia sedimenti TaxID=3064282 RepID=A0ABU0YS45_9PROT|nr:DUF2958 domain-containing protein [Rhodospirillaceae bacterium R-7]